MSIDLGSAENMQYNQNLSAQKLVIYCASEIDGSSYTHYLNLVRTSIQQGYRTFEFDLSNTRIHPQQRYWLYY